MKSLWFIVPAHGRAELTRVCLRQLRRTCDQLADHGLHASAVVVADDENLETARELDFATYEQQNQPLGRKWNDGYELAGRYGQADYFVPLGSDDWVDPGFIADTLPAANEIRCSRQSAVVSEDGARLARLTIPYDIGDGVRVIPRALLEPLRFRPAAEHKPRAIDTSIMERIRQVAAHRLVYHDRDALQIVDFKSSEQLNSYERCLVFRRGDEVDPWEALAGRYPLEAIQEMQHVYGLVAA